MQSIQIIEALDTQSLKAARELILEYGRSIIDVASCSLEHQNFDTEVASLPGKYAPPRGTLLLARVAGELAGCVALRPIDEVGPGYCEMKRMYVRPAFRGQGIGRVLAERLVADGKRMGYRVMKLDTDSHEKFTAAIALYRSLGFVECTRYNADPDPRTLWFELKLA